jgi:hypothetical protein
MLYEGSIGGYHRTPQMLRLRDQIEATMPLWHHPMLLHRILIDMHMQDANRFSTEVLWNNTKNIERTLGVTRIGRSVDHDKELDATLRQFIKNQKERILLTAKLNTTITDVLIFIRLLQWDQRHFVVFDDLCEELKKYNCCSAYAWREIKETMAWLTSSAMSALERGQMIQARLGVQLDIVCTRRRQYHYRSSTNDWCSCTISLLKRTIWLPRTIAISTSD